MDAGQLTAALKGEARRLGFDLAGACPAVAPPGLGRFRRWLAAGRAGRMGYLAARSRAYEHPGHVLDGARSLLMLGLNYRTAEPAEAGLGEGRVSRYAWGGVDYHGLVRGRLAQLEAFHRRVAPGARVRGVVDTAPLLERDYAQLAGLGWIGKNTLLLDSRLGSWVFLAALLTSAVLCYDEPQGAGHCGSCRACLDACPTGALVAPYQLDARRCISYLTIEVRSWVAEEHRGGTRRWVFGCDVCQEVCPWNRKTPTTEEPGFQPRADTNPVDLVELMRLDERGFRERFRRTPLWRARRAGVLRNAALALGHCPHGPALAALADRLNDPDPTVRSAAAWALGAAAHPAAERWLGQRLAIEGDRVVIQEIRHALSGRAGSGS